MSIHDCRRDQYLLPLMEMALQGLYGFRPVGGRMEFRRNGDLSELALTQNGWLLAHDERKFRGRLGEVLDRAESNTRFDRVIRTQQRFDDFTLFLQLRHVNGVIEEGQDLTFKACLHGIVYAHQPLEWKLTPYGALIQRERGT